MTTQTGSIDLTATNGVKLFAAAGFKTAEKTYATKGELEVTNEQVALRATKTEASQMAQPNLAPLFSMDHSSVYDATDNPSGYWRTKLTGNGFTQLDDGWTHFEYDNTSGSSLLYKYIRPARVPSIVPGAPYTILVEIRNNAPTGTGAHDIYLQQVSNNQFWGNVTGETIDADHVTTTTMVDLASCGASFVRRSYRLADTAHLVDESGFLFTYTIRTAAGCTNSLDLRMSIYEGIYDGPYKPYSGDVLYATQAELKVTADGISTEVSKKVNGTEIISAINQSAEEVKIQASKVAIDGTAVFTAISSKVDEAITDKGYATTTQAQGYASTAKSEAISAAASDATSKANAAQTAATNAANEAYQKLRSRGIQLVTNGNGFMGDNTNWPDLTFDGSKSNGSPGSFTKGVGYATILSAEMFPVDVSKEYLFEFDAISSDGNGRLYSLLDQYDVDGKSIRAENVQYFANTLTTLAKDLNTGDTTVTLTSASNWASTSYDYQRALIFWDYKNSYGYTYPTETYSRNYYSALYTDDSKVNKATGVITLKKAWAGPKKAKGTYVSQGRSGNSYVYAHVYVQVPTEWTHYSFVYSGLDLVKDGADDIGTFRQGTAFAKVGFLWNYNYPTVSQGQIWVTNISVKEATAKSSNAVKRTQRIYYRSNSSTPPDTPGTASSNWVTKADDGNAAWTKMHVAISSTHKYIYTCEQYEMANGTVGYTSVLLDNTITVIDGGNIITGSVKANKLDTADINVSNSLTIGALSTTTQDDILNNNVVVGGRNLLAFSSITSPNPWTSNGLTYTWSSDGWITVTGTCTNTAAALGFTFGSGVQTFQYLPAGTYTLSVESENLLDGTNAYMAVQLGTRTSSDTTKYYTLNDSGSITGVADLYVSRVSILLQAAANGKTYNGRIRFKLERGNKATDWTPAPEDTDSALSTKLDASYNRIWYAECSTVAATTAKVATITPTTTSFTLVKGQTVNVLFTATNTAAVGDITLNVNNTGAKGIRYLSNGALANLPNANYLRVNQIVTFTYDGTYWVADFSYNSDTYNRTRWQNAVKILEKPTGTWRMLCGTSSGYKQVAKGISFDLSYPLLAFSNQPAANATADTGYLSVNALTFSNTAAIQSGAANKTIYLKGTVNGNTFTIDGTNVFTTVIPTSEDGRCYIPLGIMTSATAGYFKSSKDLYAYVDGAFGPVSIREASAAAKTATNYISLHPTDGIKIANANPATATTYQHLTATATEFVVEGDSMLELDGTNGARVGKEDGINTCVGSGGFYIRNSNDVRAGFEYEAASESSPGSTTIESSDGLKLYGNVSSVDGTETGMAFIWLSGALYNRDSESASVDIVANSDPDNSSGDGIGSHVAAIFLDAGNTSGDSLSSGEPRVAIHVGKESFEIGKPTSIYSTSSVSVANQSWVSVANLTIPSTGTWMVVVTGDFAANATGRRVMACTRNAAPSSTPAYDSQNSLIMAPVNGAPTKFSSSAIIDFDADDVYYAGVWQNSGSALTTRIMIKAVRLI